MSCAGTAVVPGVYRMLCPGCDEPVMGQRGTFIMEGGVPPHLKYIIIGVEPGRGSLFLGMTWACKCGFQLNSMMTREGVLTLNLNPQQHI